jgi:hypothetical protein
MTHLYEKDWSREKLARYTGTLDQVAGIRLVEAQEGVERGSRRLDVWTGSGLSFTVLPDRGMDISACHYKGMSLAWQSPIGDAHPAFFESGGDGWLRTFQGGMLVTCGLDTYGPPVRDGNVELGQHGRATSLPARELEHHARWEGQEYRLEMRGLMRQAKVFGENIRLERKISTRMGSSRIRIEDTVTNEGWAPQAHMILYHINTGFPLLSENTVLKLDSRETLAEDEESRRGLPQWASFQPPTPGFQEQNFVHQPRPDPDSWAEVQVLNPEIRLGLRLRYQTGTLPYLNEWKMMAEGLYVLAVEPMNCNHLPGRATMRMQKTLPELQMGETRTYLIELEFLELEE